MSYKFNEAPTTESCKIYADRDKAFKALAAKRKELKAKADEALAAYTKYVKEEYAKERAAIEETFQKARQALKATKAEKVVEKPKAKKTKKEEIAEALVTTPKKAKKAKAEKKETTKSGIEVGDGFAIDCSDEIDELVDAALAEG